MTSPKDGADVDPLYVRAVLDAYRKCPATAGHVRASDRRLAEQLSRRGVPLETVAAALLLATLRRLARPADKTALGPARSLAYFAPVIDELIAEPPPPAYLQYLATRAARLVPRSR